MPPGPSGSSVPSGADGLPRSALLQDLVPDERDEVTYVKTFAISPAENEQDFIFQPHENRRLKRQQIRTVIGTRESSGRLRGATSGWDIFVHNVENEADEHEIKLYLKENGVNTMCVVLLSHLDSIYKSFKVTVADSDLSKVIAADFWPLGIGVRRYRKAQTRR